MAPLVAIRVLPKSDYARRGISAHDVIDTVLRDIGLPRITLSEKKRYDPDDLKKKLKVAMAENQDRSSAAGESGPGDTPQNTAPN